MTMIDETQGPGDKKRCETPSRGSLAIAPGPYERHVMNPSIDRLGPGIDGCHHHS